jgi:hypothetical protein
MALPSADAVSDPRLAGATSRQRALSRARLRVRVYSPEGLLLNPQDVPNA